MSVESMYIMPHAPVFIDDIGGNEINAVRKTIDALNIIGRSIAEQDPETIVVISPHGPIFSDAIAIYDFDGYAGDFELFGQPMLKQTFKKDQAFIDKLMGLSQERGLRFYPLKAKEFKKFQFKATLDHGVLVPLYFVSQHTTCPRIVAMSFGTLAYSELIESGSLIDEVALILGKKTVVIASGDQSHALKDSGPYRKHESGQLFDEKMLQCIEAEQYFDVFLDQENIEEAKECGLRSYALGIGALLAHPIESRVLSYEGPFGVGYLCAEFKVSNDKQQITNDQFEHFKSRLAFLNKCRKEHAHFYVKLAQTTIEAYVKSGEKPRLTITDKTISVDGIKISIANRNVLNEKAGVFVSIKDQSGLRGCIGTYKPARENLLKEIYFNALAASSEDARFSPLTVDDLGDIIVTVDVLSSLMPVDTVDELDVERYGIVVWDGSRSGLLLPKIEGVDTVEEQLKIASNKAGFTVDKIKRIEKFTVDRYK